MISRRFRRRTATRVIGRLCRGIGRQDRLLSQGVLVAVAFRGFWGCVRAGVGDMGEQIVKVSSGGLGGHIEFGWVEEIHVGVAEGGLHLFVHDDGVQGREGGRRGRLCWSHASSTLSGSNRSKYHDGELRATGHSRVVLDLGRCSCRVWTVGGGGRRSSEERQVETKADQSVRESRIFTRCTRTGLPRPWLLEQE